MNTKDIYREIINEHNLHPSHRGEINDPTYEMDGVNPSCGDKIKLQQSKRQRHYRRHRILRKRRAVSGFLRYYAGFGYSKAEETERLTEAFMRMIKEASEKSQILEGRRLPTLLICPQEMRRTYGKMENFQENQQ